MNLKPLQLRLEMAKLTCKGYGDPPRQAENAMSQEETLAHTAGSEMKSRPLWRPCPTAGKEAALHEKECIKNL